VTGKESTEMKKENNTIGCVIIKTLRRYILRTFLFSKHNSFFLDKHSTIMDPPEGRKRQGAFMKFVGEYWALFIKMLLLTKRKRTQTIVEFLLAYLFLGLLLGMRYLQDRNYKPALVIPSFRPFDTMLTNSTTANITYYYPCRFLL
jgi:hypothetical protein